jgi:DNA-binding NarL/FixJ family response regulator
MSTSSSATPWPPEARVLVQASRRRWSGSLRARETGPAFEHRSGHCPFPSGRRGVHAVPVKGTTIRVLVVDDHPMVRDGVSAALAGREEMLVVGAAGSRREAIDAALRLRPDVVLMDLHMPGGGGVEAIRDLGRTCPEARCVVLTMDDDDESLFSAMRAGARGYLLKGSRGDEIERAVRAAAAGEVVFGSEVAERVTALFNGAPSSSRHEAFPQLSDRDVILLDLIARGLDNAEIGRSLGLASKTVRNQVSLLLTKLGVPDRARAVIAGRDAGLGRSAPAR